MPSSAAPAIALALVLDVALGVALLAPGALAARPAIIGAPQLAPVTAPADRAGVDPLVRGRLTADDVARGVWALATDPASPGLTDAQRWTLAERVARGAAGRAALAPLRMERRARAEAWVASGRDLSAAVPPTALAAGAAATRRPPGPAPGAPPGAPPPPPAPGPR